MARLPEPFLPLQDSDIKALIKQNSHLLEFDISGSGTLFLFDPMPRIIFRAGNRMGTARRCNLARLCLNLERDEHSRSDPEWIEILTRVSELINTSLINPNSPIKPTDLPMYSRMVKFGHPTISSLARAIELELLILPEDSIRELKHDGLLK